MQYRVRNGTALIATTSSKSYTVTGLSPNTAYTLSVTAYNGLRESESKSISVLTRGIRIRVPTTLTVGSTANVTYLEYPLGIVPIGTEPSGFFGGGNRQTLPVKVVSVSNGISTLEITSKFSNFPDNQLMKQLDDGSFGAFDGVKAIYFKN